MDASLDVDARGVWQSFASPDDVDSSEWSPSFEPPQPIATEWRFGNTKPRPILVRADRPLLIVMKQGEARLGCGSFRATIGGRYGALLARSAVAKLDMAADAQALLISFDRAAFQMAASSMMSVPHRLISSNASLALPGAAALIAALSTRRANDMALYARLVDALLRDVGPAPRLQPVEALIRANDYINAHPDGVFTGKDVAAAAGLCLRSLSRAYRDVLGVRLADYLLQARLQRVRDRLSSGFECRTIREIAIDAGFGSATAFARLYARCFGETPSQTRARKAAERFSY